MSTDTTEIIVMDKALVSPTESAIVDTPSKVGAKEFETLILWQARKVDEPKRCYTMGRYGVMSVFIKGRWTPVPSLPDFEGVMAGGRQFIFDVKVCSQPAYDLTGGTSKSFKHQYRHMLQRSKFGALCFLLIHYNARTTKTKCDPARTFALPITDDNPLWQAYEKGEQKSITRMEAGLYGIEMLWHSPGKKVLPNLNKLLNDTCITLNNEQKGN